MIQSPFLKTLWTDVDCEIKGDLTSLFDTCENETGFAIAPQPKFALQNYIQRGLLQPGQITYNAGVVVFRYQSLVLTKWVEAIVKKNGCFPGDDVVRSEKIAIYELPQIYNWRMAQGENPEAMIIHWVADWGKQEIKNRMKNLSLDTFES